jgi:multiple sugar transport system permease protein
VTLREVRRQGLIYVGLAPFVVIALFPICWMAITAFKQDADLYRMDVAPFWFHLPPTFEHFTRLFTGTYFSAQLLNTLQLAVYVVAITMLTAVPAGYALARLRLPGAENLGIAIFLTYLVPPTLLFLPFSRVVAELNLQDRLWALILVYPSFTIPFATWLLMGFFKSIPQELEDAALMDGCSRFGALTRIVLPVSVPGTCARASKSPAPIFCVASLSAETGRSKRRVSTVETKRPSASAASATATVIAFIRSAVRRTLSLLRTMAS